MGSPTLDLWSKEDPSVGLRVTSSLIEIILAQ